MYVCMYVCITMYVCMYSVYVCMCMYVCMYVSFQKHGKYCFSFLACNPSPCQNGGSCTLGGADGFSCQCTAGFTGKICSTSKKYVTFDNKCKRTFPRIKPGRFTNVFTKTRTNGKCKMTITLHLRLKFKESLSTKI